MDFAQLRQHSCLQQLANVYTHTESGQFVTVDSAVNNHWIYRLAEREYLRNSRSHDSAVKDSAWPAKFIVHRSRSQTFRDSRECTRKISAHYIHTSVELISHLTDLSLFDIGVLLDFFYHFDVLFCEIDKLNCYFGSILFNRSSLNFNI